MQRPFLVAEITNTWCTARNPTGFCREHNTVYWKPIGIERASGTWAQFWKNRGCDCVIGAPGLEPCDVCGERGDGCLPDAGACYPGICREVVACYESMCSHIIDNLGAAEKRQENCLTTEMTRTSGMHYKSVQDRAFRRQLLGNSARGRDLFSGVM